MIAHIVFIWVKPEFAAEASRKIIDDAHVVLAKLPMVRNLIAGKTLPSNRGVVDTTYDAALSMNFASRADLEAYLNHPTHLQYVETAIKPYVERLVVYDFEG